MRRLLLSILIISFSIFSGCVPVLVGTGVVCGYMLSNDSAVGEIKSDYRTLWDMSASVVKKLPYAEIIRLDESKGRIKAKVSEIDLVIKIDSIEPNLQRLKVSARKYLLPKPQYAQKVFFKIVKELE